MDRESNRETALKLISCFDFSLCPLVSVSVLVREVWKNGLGKGLSQQSNSERGWWKKMDEDQRLWKWLH